MRADQAFLELANAIKRTGATPCQETDPELWFPDQGGENFNFRTAKKFCGMCAVKTECLNFALVNQELHGIWGGLAPRERQRIRMKR